MTEWADSVMEPKSWLTTIASVASTLVVEARISDGNEALFLKHLINILKHTVFHKIGKKTKLLIYGTYHA